jgi:UDP-N-acetylmuramate dehydrogenase
MAEPSADLAGALSFLGDRLEADRPIGLLSTYRVGGPARWYVEVADEVELSRIARAVAALAPPAAAVGPVPVLVVGKGSNLLVRDAGFDGLVLQLGEAFAGIEVQRDGAGRVGGDAGDSGRVAGAARVMVRAGGAASLPVVARRTVAEGLGGFEWAVGVPGSIGGAVRMNAGGHGSDMAAVLAGVRVVDLLTGETLDMAPADLHLSYRSSSLAVHQVVTWADLSLPPGDGAAGEAELAEIVRWRREHQPGGHNAGSVFTNPPGDSAGRLIEAAGGKGLRIGTAVVSPKHANFIQADDGGSADDVFALMVEVARRVRAHSGVELRPETRMVGFPAFTEACR